MYPGMNSAEPDAESVQDLGTVCNAACIALGKIGENRDDARGKRVGSASAPARVTRDAARELRRGGALACVREPLSQAL